MTKEYLNITQLAERYPFSEQTIRRLRKKGMFPEGKQVSAQITVWTNIEIEEWLDKRSDVTLPQGLPE